MLGVISLATARCNTDADRRHVRGEERACLLVFNNTLGPLPVNEVRFEILCSR
jgi:hypothetical protein